MVNIRLDIPGRHRDADYHDYDRLLPVTLSTPPKKSPEFFDISSYPAERRRPRRTHEHPDESNKQSLITYCIAFFV